MWFINWNIIRRDWASQRKVILNIFILYDISRLKPSDLRGLINVRRANEWKLSNYSIVLFVCRFVNFLLLARLDSRWQIIIKASWEEKKNVRTIFQKVTEGETKWASNELMNSAIYNVPRSVCNVLINFEPSCRIICVIRLSYPPMTCQSHMKNYIQRKN